MTQQLVLSIVGLGMAVFIGVLMLVQIAAKEIGYWFGQRRAISGDVPGEGVGIVVGGMLGLLAFVLALTLSFASARFQERRDGALAEANAIGTSWLRAHAIGHPRGAAIAQRLEEYAHLRIDFIRTDAGSDRIGDINARTNAMQSELWGHVSAIIRERSDAAATSLMTSLNETFDLATAERFAFAIGFPPQLFWLLIGMALISMAALGFQLGLRQRPLRLLSLMLIGMWTVTIASILDLGSARAGNIRVPTLAHEWTIQGFSGGVTVPPAPAAR